MRYYGAIGFEEMSHDGSLYTPMYVERDYKGDVYNVTLSRQPVGELNDTLTITQEISIVIDQYAMQHYSNIVYVVLNGVAWTVSRVTLNYPRLKLELGGRFARYDGDETSVGPETPGTIVGP